MKLAEHCSVINCFYASTYHCLKNLAFQVIESAMSVVTSLFRDMANSKHRLTGAMATFRYYRKQDTEKDFCQATSDHWLCEGNLRLDRIILNRMDFVPVYFGYLAM